MNLPDYNIESVKAKKIEKTTFTIPNLDELQFFRNIQKNKEIEAPIKKLLKRINNVNKNGGTRLYISSKLDSDLKYNLRKKGYKVGKIVSELKKGCFAKGQNSVRRYIDWKN